MFRLGADCRLWSRRSLQLRERPYLHSHAGRFGCGFYHLPRRRIADERASSTGWNLAQVDLQKSRQHELADAARMDRTKEQLFGRCGDPDLPRNFILLSEKIDQGRLGQ